MAAANVPERQDGKRVLTQVNKQIGATIQRVHTVWVDGGDDNQPFYRSAIKTLRWVI